ncbi:mobile mystery protein B [Algoriphagus sp. NBT04N3]|jgi:Fic-DOC domain mobile mystery protein B|uniref:mobile mystery protein B n=1 Tax=Algoriphagus sp. NBT04N3 TaxID=2705473 RepID=UPI001C637668|nr:mobile mystery protein B [Algoriphagus sp. NBT04N3]QYH40682.1 mobile mystery protein B [Algoriphagus sp. NBT04N3]
MGLDLEYIYGQTPLNEDEKEGLLISTIATREELDEFEQQNIEEALQWILTRSFKAEILLTEKFICNLHKRMYGNVWSWAGKFRKTDKNLGIDKWQIPVATKALCDDSLFWVKNSIYSPEEIAIRFKHRIVSIHCFPNGNGRHSRLMADIIINKIYNLPMFSWGTSDLVHQGDARSAYLKAVKEADNGFIQPLIEFAKS